LHLVPPTSPARITGPPKESYSLNRFNRIAGKRARGYLDVGKRKRQAHPERHSERSEKSLSGQNPRKESFIAQKACDGAEILTPQTPFGMTKREFFRKL
jgi:hypothetical protein